MPLVIAPALKTQLIERIKAELEKATVYANYIVSTWSLNGLYGVKSLPDKGTLAQNLRDYIGDDPLATFVTEELDSVFKGPGLDVEAGEAPLSSYDGYNDLATVATTLVDTFSTLPWSYCVTVRLPDSFGVPCLAMLGDYELSKRHRIVSGATLAASFPLSEAPKGLAALLMTGDPASAWNEGSAYFQVAIEGYMRKKHTEPFLSARDDVLTFFGLGIALGLLAKSPFEVMAADKEMRFLLHRMVEEKWKEQSAIELEDHYREGIGKLKLIEPARSSAEVLQEKLDRIGTIFRSSEGKNVALSSRWLFDSLCGKDPLLQYIQATVAIEILLGDEEADPDVGLTTLMANRFAYSIAKTPAARTQFLKKFRDIYHVRSKIVHRGKSRLNRREVQLFELLHLLLRLVIDSEQRLLERAEQITNDKANAGA